MDAVDVILRDGATLRLRSPRREDSEELLAFFRGLSERSLYLRFHGFRHLDERALEQVLDPDWAERGALLGTVSGGRRRARRRARELRPPARSHGGRGCLRRRGHVPASRDRNSTRRAARQRAAAHGIERFLAEVLADNRDMLGVFEAIGFELTRELAGGEMEVEFPIGATERYEARVAERDHVGGDRVAASVLRARARWP